MVSKKLIKEYEFNTIEDYFNYILDSKTNGQNRQARELFYKLSRSQKNNFCYYLANMEMSYSVFVCGL